MDSQVQVAGRYVQTLEDAIAALGRRHRAGETKVLSEKQCVAWGCNGNGSWLELDDPEKSCGCGYPNASPPCTNCTDAPEEGWPKVLMICDKCKGSGVIRIYGIELATHLGCPVAIGVLGAPEKNMDRCYFGHEVMVRSALACVRHVFHSEVDFGQPRQVRLSIEAIETWMADRTPENLQKAVNIGTKCRRMRWISRMACGLLEIGMAYLRETISECKAQFPGLDFDGAISVALLEWVYE